MSNLSLQKIVLLMVTEVGKIILKKKRPLLLARNVVGAAPTGYAPTTSEWSTTFLPIKVRLILEAWL